MSFASFESWSLFEGYAYKIERYRITKSLKLLNSDPKIFELIQSEIQVDWQDALNLAATDLIPENLKHFARIAYLSKMIPIDGIQPVCIDTYASSFSKLEGHHRLLDLKYLKADYFPAFLNGRCDILEELI